MRRVRADETWALLQPNHHRRRNLKRTLFHSHFIRPSSCGCVSNSCQGKIRTSVRNWPQSGGSTSSAKITAPSDSRSSVALNPARHKPGRGGAEKEQSGGGEGSAC